MQALAISRRDGGQDQLWAADAPVCTENLIRILLRDSSPDAAIPLPGSRAEC